MINETDKTCCFSGHRKIPPEDFNEIFKRLETMIIRLIKVGYVNFCSGGALGFDLLAAQKIIGLRKVYPQIKLLLILPCENQSEYWKNEEQELYTQIKLAADEIIYTSKTYFRGCMHKRNRCLVDSSSAFVCYLTEEKGGTAYTVKYARSKKLCIYNVAEK